MSLPAFSLAGYHSSVESPVPQHNAIHRDSLPVCRASGRPANCYVLAWEQPALVEEELRQRSMHPVDGVFFAAAQIHRRNVAVGNARPGCRQRSTHIQIKAAGSAARRRNVGHLPRCVESGVREDCHFVRIDGRIGTVKRAGDLHDAVLGQVAQSCAAIPLGLPVHVHRELAAMRSLNHKRLCAGVHV